VRATGLGAESVNRATTAVALPTRAMFWISLTSGVAGHDPDDEVHDEPVWRPIALVPPAGYGTLLLRSAARMSASMNRATDRA
jgi:hypothetical protein